MWRCLFYGNMVCLLERSTFLSASHTKSSFTVAHNQTPTKDRIMCGRPHLPIHCLSPTPSTAQYIFEKDAQEPFKVFSCEYLTFADQSERNRLIKFNEMEYLDVCGCVVNTRELGVSMCTKETAVEEPEPVQDKMSFP